MIDAPPQERGDRFAARTGFEDVPTYHSKLVKIEPVDADENRDGGPPKKMMETQ
ncbi:hypothetical protein AB0B89_23240 [Sphaerisporangium sp. NPDC049002]|uniref:hypothetical protein n=1 Tax=unclassified Sphaerisporangium TaxID=2630420 RepID=UPI0033FDCBA2